MRWVIKGIKTGIVSTRYPEEEDNTPGISPGIPYADNRSKNDSGALISCCPTGALSRENDRMMVDRAYCVHCFRCIRDVSKPISWETGFEWAGIRGSSSIFPKPFRQSLHIKVIDTGGCGACLNEVKLLNNPYYNMHRLGFFITPTPRQADILLVVGPVAEQMRAPLLKTYEAMPAPRRIVAVGSCALRGGVFAPGFFSSSGVADTLPVAVEIPGCPPPPLAMLHGLLVLSGRKQEGDLHVGGGQYSTKEKGARG
jgi:Ni,Fe-hydrogenase III small subunit/ferredoxin-like protein FixX